MVGKIKELADANYVTEQLVQYCDERGIHIGSDGRRFDDEGIVKYTFYKDDIAECIVINFRETSPDIFGSLDGLLDHLDRKFDKHSCICRALFDNARFEVMQEIAQYKKNSSKFEIEKVIFNNPATIVFWADGTKTVVKRQKGDRYDKEKGLAMAIAKKLYGNTGKYCDIFKEHLD